MARRLCADLTLPGVVESHDLAEEGLDLLAGGSGTTGRAAWGRGGAAGRGRVGLGGGGGVGGRRRGGGLRGGHWADGAAAGPGGGLEGGRGGSSRAGWGRRGWLSRSVAAGTAGEGPWAGGGVGGVAAVEVVGETDSVVLVRAREADGLRVGVSATSDGDLSAVGVHLGAHGAVGLVQTDDLDTEEVVTVSNTAGDGEGDHSLVVVEALDGPGATAVLCVLVDLEPLDTGGAGGGRVVDLSEVGHDGTLVGESNWLILVTRVLGGLVVPLGGDLRASLDADLDGGRAGCVLAACNVRAGRILGGVVGLGGVLPLVADSTLLHLSGGLAIDPEGLEGGVGGGSGRQKGHESEGLHC